MIVDGKTLAEERKKEVATYRRQQGPLSLGVVIAGDSAVTDSFVRIKKCVAASLDIEVVEHRVSEGTDTEVVLKSLEQAALHNGVIVQLPLPEDVDVDRVRNAIPPEIDVDVLGDSAFSLFEKGAGKAVPPVAAAMKYILERNGFSVSEKKVVVIGQGRLVGRPAAVLFKNLGGAVSIVSRGDDIAAETREADIVVLGAGMPGLLKPDMVKDGVIILDAGTSESEGKVVGDADPACAEKASLFTPVPGGIGPIAVVEIFANLVALQEPH